MKNKIKIPGRQRVVIEQVSPEIDCGRFPIKRCVNDSVTVTAVIFAEGHDELSAVVKYRPNHRTEWQTIPMQPLDNDHWQAVFTVTEMGEHSYTLEAWVDYFHSWRRNLMRWLESKQDLAIQLLIGAELILTAAQSASPKDAERLQFFANALKNASPESINTRVLDPELSSLMAHYSDQTHSTTYGKTLKITVDRERARFSTWYEVFPRSLGQDQHGTLRDLIAHLPYIVDMGFDVIYLPPIHPIGKTYRKGKNNAPIALANDPGSPWGIGSAEGGHTEIHPQLGRFDDFQALIDKAKELNVEIALDFALQCSPDHPYVRKHPRWFKQRPDGAIQYAENPPKKYQDIYPFDFQSEQWSQMWQECLNIVLFWIQQGIRIFRVDNPHTKPFLFWEWLITQIKSQYPEVLFLSEAFTRPNPMYYLAKLGFSQSYTYFTWRNTKREIIEYFSELHHSLINQFFRPNFWPNTPDILHEFLQTGGRPAFIARLVLAATASSNYGLYGPVYELCIPVPRESGSEEYLNSEKYEIIRWNLAAPHSLNNLLAKINQIRRENPCLQNNLNFRFHDINNDQLIAYSKSTADKNNIIVTVINLDPHHTQSGWLELPLSDFEISANEPYVMHDLLDDARYLWHGPRNYIELNPQKLPAHILRVRPHIQHEQDFKEY